MAESSPFENNSDIKILFNDWPYGVDSDIVHLVFWTKFELPDDPVTGELTPQTRQQIDNYVIKTFHSHVSEENVIWFKNWAALKSIHAVEHFHVMLYAADPDFVREITNNDVPMYLK